MAQSKAETETTAKKPLYRSLYFQVVTAIVIGVLLGYFYPDSGAAMKPLGDGFIKLIKMIIAPIIFCTVVVGIAGMEDMKKVGKTGGFALIYFEIVSSIALVVGLAIVNLIQPGTGMNIDPATLDTSSVAAYTKPGQMQSTDGFSAAYHSQHDGRCLRAGRNPAGAADFDPVRFRAAQVRRPRHAGVRRYRENVARAVFRGRHHHEVCPDRRLRRDGVHHRQIRRGFAALARQADGHVLLRPALSSFLSCLEPSPGCTASASGSSSGTSRKNC